MTVWEFLLRAGPGWPDQRGWYALALFIQTCAILCMVVAAPQLAHDEFFKSLGTAIVVTGWVGFAVAGRDNRLDREQVGAALRIAGDQAAHIRQQSAPSTRQPDGGQ